MYVYARVNKMFYDLKGYDGLGGFKKNDNGFKVATKISDDILDKTERGWRENKAEVIITKESVEFSRIVTSFKKVDKNIVGLRILIDWGKQFLKEKNLSMVSISLDLLEIKGLVREYIRMFEFSWD